MRWTDNDVVIAGAGLAGALLAWRLYQNGKRIVWVDPYASGRSTNAGAGIINPVTGKKFVLSWRYQEFLDEARTTYHALERMAKTSLIQAFSIEKHLFTEEEETRWLYRRGFKEYAALLSTVSSQDYNSTHPDYCSIGTITEAFKVDMTGVVAVVKKIIGPPVPGMVVSPRAIKYGETLWEIPQETPCFHCTGFQVFDEWQSLIPLSPYKGEGFILQASDLPKDRVVVNKLKVVPLRNDFYWVGSVNDCWAWDHVGPSQEGLEEFMSKWKANFKIDCTIWAHFAGIRPSSDTRRPIAGRLPVPTEEWVLNGLGTKGALLAPLVTKNLANAYLGKEDIEPEFQWPWVKS